MKYWARFLLSILSVSLFSGCANTGKRQPANQDLNREISSTHENFVSSFDGFRLPIIFETSDDTGPQAVARVIVIAHGSGPQNADGDLSSVSAPTDQPNFIYKDIAGALREKGFATVRFNKRSFEARERIQRDPGYVHSSEFLSYQKDPLGYFIKDLEAVCADAKLRFPSAKVFVLGHSEGTNLALWLASRDLIAGAALLGFANEKQSTLIHEQFVDRAYLNYFRLLDKNNDLKIDKRELNSKDELAKQLKRQLPILDLNSDGAIDWTEYSGGNYSNAVLSKGLYDSAYAVTEAGMPRPSEVLEKTNLPILVLQGELDNQTPSYYAKGVDIANRAYWHKNNLKFVYFAGKGHALDSRSSYADLSFKRIDSKTLKRIADEVGSFLK